MVLLLKFIFFFFVILWLISKVFGFVARVFLGRVAKENGGRGFYQKTYQSGNRKEEAKPKDGNVHIDYVPKDENSVSDKFKGGDYVDYEDVK